MRSARISILCAVTALAAVPTDADANGLGSLLGAVTAAPRAIFGGLVGGSARARHAHRHANAARVVAAHAAPAIAARSAPATEAQRKPADQADSAFWPSAYEDAFGYILLPAGPDGAFWAHGYADVVAGMFAPAVGFAGPHRKARIDRASIAQVGNAAADPGGTCGDPQGRAGTLIARVEQAVQPAEAQRAALDELGGALRTAENRMRAACSSAALSPAARLEAAWQRLRALRQAVAMVRTPLRNFLSALSGEQRARLDTAGGSEEARTVEAGGETAGFALRACTERARMPEWPIEPIARAIQPTPDQRPLLELLMGTSLHMAGQLKMSCPAAPPLAPAERLRATEQRLTDLVYAVTVLRGALNKFYGSLTDEQKARFDSLAQGEDDRRRAELR
jgi:hypothetical protein